MADFVREGGITRLTRLTDGRVMCCICMEYKIRDELADVEGEPGRKWDVCKPCQSIEDGTARRRVAAMSRKEQS